MVLTCAFSQLNVNLNNFFKYFGYVRTRALMFIHMALHPSIHPDTNSLQCTGISVYECKGHDVLFNLVYHTPPSHEQYCSSNALYYSWVHPSMSMISLKQVNLVLRKSIHILYLIIRRFTCFKKISPQECEMIFLKQVNLVLRKSIHISLLFD